MDSNIWQHAIELGYGHFFWNLDEIENLLRVKLDFGWKLAMKLDWFDINFGSCGFQDTWRDVLEEDWLVMMLHLLIRTALGHSLWITNISIRNEHVVQAKLGQNGMILWQSKKV
jgi:hypothetical protein